MAFRPTATVAVSAALAAHIAAGDPHPLYATDVAAAGLVTAHAVHLAPMVAARYYRCPNGILGTNNASGVGLLRLLPKYVPATVTVAKIAGEISGAGEAGSKLRLGIYADAGDFSPGALVLDAGQIAGDSATAQELTPGAPPQLLPGWYWFGGVVQAVTTTQPTVRVVITPAEPCPVHWGAALPAANVNAIGMAMSGVTGALPANFVATSTAASGPAIFVRTA